MKQVIEKYEIGLKKKRMPGQETQVCLEMMDDR